MDWKILLYIVVENDYWFLVDLFLENEVKLENIINEGDFVIILVVLNGYIELVKIFVEEGIEFEFFKVWEEDLDER